MRIIIAGLVVVAAGLTLTSDLGRAQSPDYQLVADWPRMAGSVGTRCSRSCPSSGRSQA